MCILAWHWTPGATTELLLVANRDEAYARAAAPLHLWENGEILAGRDHVAGGTWLGVGRRKRFAALTNHRTGQAPDPTAPSRGGLVRDFLLGAASAHDYLAQLAPHSTRYNPFNLLVWDGEALLGLEGRHGRIVTLQPGWGSVSNGDFNSPWPKQQRLLDGLRHAVQQDAASNKDLLALLADETQAPPALLPQTGVDAATEQALSPIFIRTPHYGTRASTVVHLQSGQAHMLERSFVDGAARQHTAQTIAFSATGCESK